MNRVFVGYDPREANAYRACVHSLRSVSRDFELNPINYRLLGSQYLRPTSRARTLSGGSTLWDDISRAPMSTEFSLARFFVPVMQRSGWAIYCDGDFMFRAPIERLLTLADDRYAVMVVKHEHAARDGDAKMDGQVQTAYERKNWSSLILFNCTRIAEQFPGDDLSVVVNTVPGLHLHQFRWLRDTDIGDLPIDWNWLVGVSAHMDNPQAVHFTLGTPDLPGYERAPFAGEWRGHAFASRG